MSRKTPGEDIGYASQVTENIDWQEEMGIPQDICKILNSDVGYIPLNLFIFSDRRNSNTQMQSALERVNINTVGELYKAIQKIEYGTMPIPGIEKVSIDILKQHLSYYGLEIQTYRANPVEKIHFVNPNHPLDKGANGRMQALCKQYNITQIRQLQEIVDGELSIKGIGESSIEMIRLAIEQHKLTEVSAMNYLDDFKDFLVSNLDFLGNNDEVSLGSNFQSVQQFLHDDVDMFEMLDIEKVMEYELFEPCADDTFFNTHNQNNFATSYDESTAIWSVYDVSDTIDSRLNLETASFLFSFSRNDVLNDETFMGEVRKKIKGEFKAME